MAETDSKTPPIIIKKIIDGGHAHHGGAWKVAYADFVTAMMAFFLLLWLLSATSPEQKKGLADYFTPTIGIKDSQGIGFNGGKLISSKAGRANRDTVAPSLVVGRVAQGPVNAPPAPHTEKNPDAEASASEMNADNTNGETKDQTADVEQFKSTEEQVKQMIEKDPEIREYQNDIIVQQAPDGLKIDLIDDRKKPMFETGGAVLTETGKKVLDAMASVVAKTPNNVAIFGHTGTAPVSESDPQYTNWELSADRANAARRFLVTTQLSPDRVLKVVGKADRELLLPQEPTNPRNQRITILVMRGSYYRDNHKHVVPTTRSLLSVPEVKKPPKKPEVKPEIKDKKEEPAKEPGSDAEEAPADSTGEQESNP